MARGGVGRGGRGEGLDCFWYILVGTRDCFSLPKINKSRFEEATSELGVAKREETEEKTKIQKLMEEKGLLLVELVNGSA